MQRRMFLAAAATCCFLGASSAVPVAAPSELYEGKIAASGVNAITVLAMNGENIAFMIPADCKITIDGEPSTADKLAVGLSVKIMATKMGSAHVAKIINAASAE